jgi:GNAT superfamily N-acetyltransferase
MKRSQVSLRRALPEDAPELTLLWADALRRAEPEDQLADVRRILDRIEDSDDEEIVVATYDGALAGAVHLRADTLTPLNLEPVVQVISPYVLPEYRRHGVGRALMECAVAFAEERGLAHIATAAATASRDGNRFLARLALASHAILRIAPTHAVRTKLTAQRPPVGSSGRQLTRVLAARRSMRRSQATSAG